MRKDGVQRQLENAQYSVSVCGRVGPINIRRSNVSKLATLIVRFTMGQFEGFYSAKVGRMLNQNMGVPYPPGTGYRVEGTVPVLRVQYSNRILKPDGRILHPRLAGECFRLRQ